MAIRRIKKRVTKDMDRTAALKKASAKYRKMFAETKTLSDKIVKKIADKVDESIEKILLDTENTIKEHVPSRYIKAAFDQTRAGLYKNGINCTFNTRATRMQVRKASAVECNEDDVCEACDEIVNAAVEEIEQVLETADNTIEAMAKKHCSMKKTASVIMKRKLAKELLTRGVKCKF